MFYEEAVDNKVVCGLCNHHCHIKDGRRGICGVRENQGGKLYSLVYGKLVSENSDPVEKSLSSISRPAPGPTPYQQLAATSGVFIARITRSPNTPECMMVIFSAPTELLKLL